MIHHRWGAKAGLGLCLAVVLVGGAMGQDDQGSPEGWEGTRVVLLRPESVLKIGRRVVARPDVLRVYRIEQVNGPWVWLVADDVSGWARASEVSPVEAAEDFYSDQIAQGRDAAYAHYMRGLIRSDLGDHERAVGDLEEAVRLRPDDFPAAYLGLGIARGKRGDLDGAVAAFDRAIRLAPFDALNYYNRAMAHQDAGRIVEAIDDLGRALRLDPLHASARFNRAALALAIVPGGSAADATAYLDLIGWEEPYSGYAALLGALGHRGADQAELADRLLDEAARELDPSAWPYPIVRHLRGEIDVEEVVSSAKSEPLRIEALAYAGLNLALSGEPEEAAPLLRRVIEEGDPALIPHALARAELERSGRVGPAAEPGGSTGNAPDQAPP